MAQTVITASKNTWIAKGDNTPHSGAPYSLVNWWTAEYEQKVPQDWQPLTAVFQFVIPTTLKYKKINKVTLKFLLEDSNAGVKQGTGLIVAPCIYGNVIDNLIFDNRNTIGTFGERITYETNSQIGESLPINKTADITDIYVNNVFGNQYFTIAINTFPTPSSFGACKIKNNNPTITIDYEDAEQLAPTAAYPNGVYLNENEDILFSWNYNSSTAAVQRSVVLEYKNVNAGSYTVVNLTQPGYSWKLVGGLPQGSYQWRAKVTNDVGETSGYSQIATFNVIGKPAAPSINTPANNCRTTISWNASDQNAYEITLTAADGTEIINEAVSSASTEYKVNMFLANGSYTVGIRTKNSTGMWSDWAYKIFAISAAGPANIEAKVRPDGNKVHVSFAPQANVNVAIMRQEAGKNAECIAIITEPGQTDYVDYTARHNVEYAYFVRSYVTGYTDSKKHPVCISVNGMCLISSDYEVNLTRSEDKYLDYREHIGRDTTLLKFSGREFPFVERGEFSEQNVTRNFFVNENERITLNEMIKESRAFYRDNQGNAFDCALINVDYKRYENKGYIATLELERIEKSEVAVNV